MKILYAIQGTGNGHLSRANDIVPVLQKKCDLDILVSGMQADVSIPFDIKYRLQGLSFIFGKKGGIDFWDTFKKADIKQFRKDIKTLPVNDYDLVINDFEPVSAFASKKSKVLCISLSHQAAVINKKSPKPKTKDLIGKAILENYAPCKFHYGFHFEQYDKNIFTPVIRQQVRNQIVSNLGHYTVYLPAYGDEKLIEVLSKYKEVQWEVFSKHSNKNYEVKNISIKQINNAAFINSMASCEGMLCGAGFETPAEALFLEKKLMVLPMKAQYEQHCNAAALEQMGVPVLKSLKEKHADKIGAWLKSNKRIAVNYPDNTEAIIDKMFQTHFP